jgi:hypothetical protein
VATPVGDRLKHAWNALTDRNQNRQHWWGTEEDSFNLYGQSSGRRPDRVTLRIGTDKSIIASIYNRMAMDVASIKVQHVRQDQNGRFIEEMDTKLNKALNLRANMDQIGRAFMQDVVMSMFDEGVIAIVPYEATANPIITHAYDVTELRTGKIVEWFPKHVRVEMYNEKNGRHVQKTFPKSIVAIIENPFFSVMNENASTLQRLLRTLNRLDTIDEQSASGKLDVIIQLPYALKTPQRKAQAEERRKAVEVQLKGSQYGIAYIDATEHITQLNRPAENNMMSRVDYLTKLLFSQLGLTEGIFNGTATEQERANYYDGTIEPIISTITTELTSKFLSPTAYTQGQRIAYFRDPFKLIPMNELANLADKFIRNEILSANEFRGIVGYKPSDDPRADELRNPNIAASKDQLSPLPPGQEEAVDIGTLTEEIHQLESEESQNGGQV